MLPNTAFVAILILAGLFSLAGAILNWEWYYEFRKAKSLVNLFGREGTRIIYLALGLFLIGGGIIFALNTDVLFLASVKIEAVSKVVKFTEEIAHSEQKIMVNREMVVQELLSLYHHFSISVNCSFLEQIMGK